MSGLRRSTVRLVVVRDAMEQDSNESGLWIFAYGSLMWNPGFSPVAAVPACLSGFHRAFCVYSVLYRGSPERPGLVLGLDKGGLCHGMAFQVGADGARATLGYLRRREQVTGVYNERLCRVALSDGTGRHVQALTFVVERRHPGYAGPLSLVCQAKLIRPARGVAGTNVAYALSTISHLAEMGMREASLDRLAGLIGPMFRNSPAQDHGALVASLAHHPPGAPLFRRDQRRRFLYRNHLAARFDRTRPDQT